MTREEMMELAAQAGHPKSHGFPDCGRLNLDTYTRLVEASVRAKIAAEQQAVKVPFPKAASK